VKPLLGRLFALPSNIVLCWKKLARDKQSSLSRDFVNY
jgi:hypothetical protein